MTSFRACLDVRIPAVGGADGRQRGRPWRREGWGNCEKAKVESEKLRVKENSLPLFTFYFYFLLFIFHFPYTTTRQIFPFTLSVMYKVPSGPTYGVRTRSLRRLDLQPVPCL